MHKFEGHFLCNMFGLSLVLFSQRAYNSVVSERKDVYNMKNIMKRIFGSKLVNEERFPNLLADKDFVQYYWTLPFTTL